MTTLASLPASLRVVTIAEHPELVPVVTGWVWREFWRPDGDDLADAQAAVAASTARLGIPQTFVALADGAPVGTASLRARETDVRPELTPWLQDVYVVPAARGRGAATRLVAAVEAAARAAAIPTLWLYTDTAVRFYERLGWQAAEMVRRPSKPAVTLMRRDLGSELGGSGGAD